MAAENLTELFAIKLRALCDKEVSHAYVADKVGITRQQLSRYLSGRTMPRDGMLKAFATFFDVPSNYFFDDSGLANSRVSETVRALQSFAGCLVDTDLRDEHLPDGFYEQYKTPRFCGYL